MIQLAKRHKILLQILLFLFLSGILIYKVSATNFKAFNYAFNFSIIIALFLVPANWYLEYQKWKEILKHQSLPLENAKRSFASGMISDFLIPGIPSNFVGRIFFFEKKDRILLSVWSQISNVIQFFITFFFGTISFLIINKLDNTFPMFILVFVSLLILMTFSNFFLKKLFIIYRKYLRMIKWSNENKTLIRKLIFFSLFRFIIFSTQFALLLYSFGINVDYHVFLWIWISYVFVSLSPSLFMGNLIVRDSITVSVFQFAQYPILPVLSSTFCIWLINNFLPTFIAWIFLTFKRNP